MVFPLNGNVVYPSSPTFSPQGTISPQEAFTEFVRGPLRDELLKLGDAENPWNCLALPVGNEGPSTFTLVYWGFIPSFMYISRQYLEDHPT